MLICLSENIYNNVNSIAVKKNLRGMKEKVGASYIGEPRLLIYIKSTIYLKVAFAPAKIEKVLKRSVLGPRPFAKIEC